MFQKKNECSLEAYRFKNLVPTKLFTWNTVTIMGIEDKNTKNSIKSKKYPKGKTPEEVRKTLHWLTDILL